MIYNAFDADKRKETIQGIKNSLNSAANIGAMLLNFQDPNQQRKWSDYGRFFPPVGTPIAPAFGKMGAGIQYLAPLT
jgi:hypothetical protein